MMKEGQLIERWTVTPAAIVGGTDLSRIQGMMHRHGGKSIWGECTQWSQSMYGTGRMGIGIG